MPWGRAVDQWAAYMRASGNPTSTIDLRTYQVLRVGRALQVAPALVTTDALVCWLAEQDWKPNTRRAYRGALRAFYAWMVAAGHLERSPASALPAVRVPRALPHPTPEDAFRWALRFAEPRLRLAILLAGRYGLRRGEVTRLRREDLVPDLAGWSLRVVGKGAHERLIPLLEEDARMLLAKPPGWLFPSPRREGRPLTPAHLAKLVTAELPYGYTMHSLRHRCATVMVEETGDLRAAQEVLGHAKLETIQIYTFVSSSRRRKVVEAAA